MALLDIVRGPRPQSWVRTTAAGARVRGGVVGEPSQVSDARAKGAEVEHRVLRVGSATHSAATDDAGPGGGSPSSSVTSFEPTSLEPGTAHHRRVTPPRGGAIFYVDGVSAGACAPTTGGDAFPSAVSLLWSCPVRRRHLGVMSLGSLWRGVGPRCGYTGLVGRSPGSSADARIGSPSARSGYVDADGETVWLPRVAEDPDPVARCSAGGLGRSGLLVGLGITSVHMALAHLVLPPPGFVVGGPLVAIALAGLWLLVGVVLFGLAASRLRRRQRARYPRTRRRGPARGARPFRPRR